MHDDHRFERESAGTCGAHQRHHEMLSIERDESDRRKPCEIDESMLHRLRELFVRACAVHRDGETDLARDLGEDPRHASTRCGRNTAKDETLHPLPLPERRPNVTCRTRRRNLTTFDL